MDYSKLSDEELRALEEDEYTAPDIKAHVREELEKRTPADAEDQKRNE